MTSLEEILLIAFCGTISGCDSWDNLELYGKTKLNAWIKSFQLDLANKVVAIDGKTSRLSFDGYNKPMHMVSALASEKQ